MARGVVSVERRKYIRRQEAVSPDKWVRLTLMGTSHARLGSVFYSGGEKKSHRIAQLA